MKIITLTVVTLMTICLVSCSTIKQSTEYEYKVMTLYDMFGETQKDKVMKIAVTVNVGDAHVTRTDMDPPDYQDALNRLASEGWELVTINKSNYWIFRRPKN